MPEVAFSLEIKAKTELQIGMIVIEGLALLTAVNSNDLLPKICFKFQTEANIFGPSTVSITPRITFDTAIKFTTTIGAFLSN